MKGEETVTSMSDYTGLFMENYGNSIVNSFGNLGSMIDTGVSEFIRASTDIQDSLGENEAETWIVCVFVSVGVNY